MTRPTAPSGAHEHDRYDPGDLTDAALSEQVARWVEEVQRLHRALAVAQDRRAAVVRESMLRLQAALPRDADGDCRECGHAPEQHAAGGCFEWIDAADGDRERCDCESASDRYSAGDQV